MNYLITNLKGIRPVNTTNLYHKTNQVFIDELFGMIKTLIHNYFRLPMNSQDWFFKEIQKIKYEIKDVD